MQSHNFVRIAVILFTLLSTATSGCTRTLTIQVHDSLTLIPLANAVIDGHSYSGLFMYAPPRAKVDDQGKAILRWPNAAFETLAISAPGYLHTQINPTAQNFRDGISIALNPNLNAGR
jgi:hypothetical protein